MRNFTKSVLGRMNRIAQSSASAAPTAMDRFDVTKLLRGISDFTSAMLISFLIKLKRLRRIVHTQPIIEVEFLERAKAYPVVWSLRLGCKPVWVATFLEKASAESLERFF